MTKNITVVDENGITVGSTYPKRASGLVKKGRAHWINDDTVCLCAHKTEDKKMTDKIYDVIDNQFSKLQEKLGNMDAPEKISISMIESLTAMQTRNRELDIAEKQLDALNKLMEKEAETSDEELMRERELTKQKMLDVLSKILDGKSADNGKNVKSECHNDDKNGQSEKTETAGGKDELSDSGNESAYKITIE